MLEETGLHAEIGDYVGTWVDVYSTATLASDGPARIDPAEVSEIGWFPLDALPDELAPPGTLEAVLEAVRTPRRSHPR